MKKTLVLAAAAVASLTVGIARADDARQLTREEVVASVMAARQSGELATLNAGGTWTPKTATTAPALSRDQVNASVMAARQSGELAAINAVGTWTAPTKTPAPAVTRDQVVHEYMAAHAQPTDNSAIEHSL